MENNNNYDHRFSEALKKEHSLFFDPNSLQGNPKNLDYLPGCPVCNSKKSHLYCVKDSFIHEECVNCGLVYLNPKLSRQATIDFYNSEANEVYNETKFHSTAEDSPDNLENLENYEILMENISDIKGKRLLEIGPGNGTFLAKASNDGFEVHGVELNSLLIDKLKKITSNIYTDDILNLNLPENYFDVIYFRDVMEHIDQPIPFLTKVHSVLKPGGILIIDTHNIKSLINQATKEYHTVIFAFEHPLHWSPKSLAFAGESVGLIMKKTYFNHLYQSFSWVINYYLKPSFTFIYPPKKSSVSIFIYRCLNRILGIGIINKIDKSVSVMISKLFNKGAKMQMVFTKN